jgi:hypothetical protein
MKVGRDSVVDIATCYGLDGRERDFPHTFRPVLVLTQPPLQWVPGLSPGVKRPGRGVDHPPPSSIEAKERLELYLCSLSGSSWPAVGWTCDQLHPAENEDAREASWPPVTVWTSSRRHESLATAGNIIPIFWVYTQQIFNLLFYSVASRRVFLHHKQTKICRPVQHLNVMWRSAARFGSHETSSGTSFYNKLKTQAHLCLQFSL